MNLDAAAEMLNVGRATTVRHLNESQRGMVAARLATEHGPGRPKKGSIDPISLDQAAEMLNVSRPTAVRARHVLEHADDETIAKVDAGEATNRTGMTQAQAAAELGVSREAVRNWETESTSVGQKAKGCKRKQKPKKKKRHVTDKVEPDQWDEIYDRVEAGWSRDGRPALSRVWCLKGITQGHISTRGVG